MTFSAELVDPVVGVAVVGSVFWGGQGAEVHWALRATHLERWLAATLACSALRCVAARIGGYPVISFDGNLEDEHLSFDETFPRLSDYLDCLGDPARLTPSHGCDADTPSTRGSVNSDTHPELMAVIDRVPPTPGGP